MGLLSFWKRAFPRHAPLYSPEKHEYRPPPVISISRNLYVNGRYNEAFPKYLPLPEETAEQYEPRAIKMSQIAWNSVPTTEWCRSQCAVWIYQYLITLDVMDSHAAHEGNRFASNGLSLLVWPRSKYQQMINTHADALYDRVQEIKASLAVCERRRLENLREELYGEELYDYPDQSQDCESMAGEYPQSNCKNTQEEQMPPRYSE